MTNDETSAAAPAVDGKIRVFDAVGLPVYQRFIGHHPLILPMLRAPRPDIEFAEAGDAPPADLTATPFDRWARSFAAELQMRSSAPGLGVPAGPGDIDRFIGLRDAESQAMFDTRCDMAFLHATPLCINQMPWVMHAENIATSFDHYLKAPERYLGPIRAHPAFRLVRGMFESERCLGIFSNLKITTEQFARVFGSDRINAKVRCIRPGAWFSGSHGKIIAAEFERRMNGTDDMVILFTNSWNKTDAQNFYGRGGLELLAAFAEILKTRPDLPVRLVMRTRIPEMLAEDETLIALKAHPKVAWIDQWLEEDDMTRLIASADVFVLDSMGVRTASAMQSLYCGSTCIFSDAFGYDEYADDGVSCIQIRGRRDASSGIDPECGWLGDDYQYLDHARDGANMILPSVERVPDKRQRTRQLYDALVALAENPQRRRELGHNARQRVMTRQRFEDWSSGFADFIRAAAVKRRQQA